MPSDAFAPNTPKRIAVLLFLMIWPWPVVAFNLLMVQDYRLTMLLYGLLGCALPALYLQKYHDAKIPPLLPLHIKPRNLVLPVLVANIFFLANFKTLFPHLFQWPELVRHLQAIGLRPNLEFWIYGLYLIILNPLLEEIFWRGTIYRQWKTLVRPWQANLIASFFFGAWHWVILQHFCQPFWAVFLTGTVMLGGIIFAYAYEKTGTLGAPILLHGLGADLPLVFVAYTGLVQVYGLPGTG